MFDYEKENQSSNKVLESAGMFDNFTESSVANLHIENSHIEMTDLTLLKDTEIPKTIKNTTKKNISIANVSGTKRKLNPGTT